MKYSIIIPVYNAKDTIRRCINSVINQTFRNFECFIINDGSIDNTKEICEEIIKDDKRFILFNQNNCGVSNARNIGLSYSNGDYYIFLDSDDYLEINLLEEIDKIANDQIIQYSFYSFQNNKKKKNIYKKGSFDILAGNMAVVWRHAIPVKRIGDIRFSESLNGGEDYLFLNEVYKKIGKITVIKKCLYNHMFDNKTSIMNNIDLDILNQQIISTKKVESLYNLNELKLYKKEFNIREKWCKGELLLYTYNLFNNKNSYLLRIIKKLLKKITLLLLK